MLRDFDCINTCIEVFLFLYILYGRVFFYLLFLLILFSLIINFLILKIILRGGKKKSKDISDFRRFLFWCLIILFSM